MGLYLLIMLPKLKTCPFPWLGWLTLASLDTISHSWGRTCVSRSNCRNCSSRNSRSRRICLRSVSKSRRRILHESEHSPLLQNIVIITCKFFRKRYCSICSNSQMKWKMNTIKSNKFQITFVIDIWNTTNLH